MCDNTLQSNITEINRQMSNTLALCTRSLRFGFDLNTGRAVRWPIIHERFMAAARNARTTGQRSLLGRGNRIRHRRLGNGASECFA